MSSIIRKGVTYAANSSEVIDCIFCRITRRDPSEPATIIGENQDLVAFKTIKPTTSKHYLIAPKRHIQNVRSLTSKDAKLITDMVEFGRQMLAEDGPDGYFCFHLPPYNSIDHLHLHAIGRVFEMSCIDSVKYCQNTRWCSSAEALIESLAYIPAPTANSENSKSV